MLQQLLALLPDALTHCSARTAGWVTAAAAVCLLAGGWLSRYVLTLGLVAAGAVIGMRLPRWMGWSIDGAGLGVLGAIVLGMTGYFLTRTWVGVFLGVILAFWAAVGIWLGLNPVLEWKLPALHWSFDFADLALQLWRALPRELRTVLPLGCGSMLFLGVLTALLWPRMSRALLFSVIGASLLVGVSVPAARLYWPKLAERLPEKPSRQAAALVGLIALSTLLQWGLIVWTERKPPPEEEEADGAENEKKPTGPKKPKKLKVPKVPKADRPGDGKKVEAEAAGVDAGLPPVDPSVARPPEDAPPPDRPPDSGERGDGGVSRAAT